MYFWKTIKLSEGKKDLEVSKICRNKGILNKIYLKRHFHNLDIRNFSNLPNEFPRKRRSRINRIDKENTLKLSIYIAVIRRSS